jgi:hypothetical protein
MSGTSLDRKLRAWAKTAPTLLEHRVFSRTRSQAHIALPMITCRRQAHRLD